MAGSSFFKKIVKRAVYSITGPTGPTGPQGFDGNIGYGPTGATGVGISNISLSSGSILTQFTDGTNYQTPETISGPTGNTITPIKYEKIGDGVSIVSSQSASNNITFRSIKGISSSSGFSNLIITENPNGFTFEFITRAEGISLDNVGIDAINSFVGMTATGLSLTNVRDTNYSVQNGSATVTVTNIFEKARGLGYTGATHYYFTPTIKCNYIYDTTIDFLHSAKSVKIDPSCISDNSVDLFTTNKIYVVDMENNYGKVIIGSPISPTNSTAFTLVVKNANNSPVGYENRFQSSNNINWPFGVEPCFSGNGGTDVYHFYSLFNSWFGSVSYSSKYAGKTFDCASGSIPPDNLLGACCELDTSNSTCGITCSLKLATQCVGANKVFHGVASLCTPTICEVTGPCCMRVGCDNGAGTWTQCFDGITFENCLCGNFKTDPGDCENPPPANTSGAQYTYHDGYNCATLDECNKATCELNGCCCLPEGGSYPSTEPECTAVGGNWNQGQECSLIDCTRGRCITINFNNISASSCTYVPRSFCPVGLNAAVGVTWTAGQDCSAPFRQIGGCCTGGSCLSNTNNLLGNVSVWAPNVIGYNNISSNNKICNQGLCGSFLGVACTSEICSDSQGSQLGVCVPGLVCPNETQIAPTVTTRLACRNVYNAKFYPDINLSTQGYCCSAYYFDGLTSYNYDSTSPKNIRDCVFNNSNAPRTCPDDLGYYYDALFNLAPPSDVSTCADGDPDFGITFPQDRIFVGTYDIQSESLTGRRRAGINTFEALMSGNETAASNYFSSYDYYGYGYTFARSAPIADTIKVNIYLYKHDLITSEDIELSQWGQHSGNIAWAKRYDLDSINQIIENEFEFSGVEYVFHPDEGYWQYFPTSTSPPLYNPLLLNYATYQSSPLLTEPFNTSWIQFYVQSGTEIGHNTSFSNDGCWRRNWGLMNTMRMISADNRQYLPNGISYTIPQESWTIARKVALLNKTNPTLSNSSSWYVPSLDEMAFICENIVNVNNTLNASGGDPVIGDYWTSTGGFTWSVSIGAGTTLSEGVRIGLNPSTPGTVAWAYKITQTAGTYNITTRKEFRNKFLKSRAICIEIIDPAEVPLETSQEYKVWKLPKSKFIENLPT